MWWRSLTFMGLFFGLFLFLLPNLVWFICWIFGKIFGSHITYIPFLWISISLVLLLWFILSWGYFIGRFRIKVNNVEYVSNELPKSFDGYRITHISDLHVDSFDSKPQALKKFIDKVNSLDSDIVLFTGDLTTAEMDRLSIHENTLKSLCARDGVVSILGNHDFFIYCPEYKTDKDRCAAADTLTSYERDSLGWIVLRNDHIFLHHFSDSIAIAGVDNINGNQGFSTIQMGDLSKAMNGLDDTFTVLMTHDPSHWQAEVLPQSYAQITLSGHTHAGQARIFGWSLANLIFRECDGRYDFNDRMLYVNAGTGCTAPFRFNCPSEITIITLKSGD